MQVLKGITASISIAMTTVAVYVPLTWWLLRLPITKGEALRRLRHRMDKILWWWTGSNRRMIQGLGHATVAEIGRAHV